MRHFIEGIYNYCDRWCERCAYTSRCSSFAIEKKLKEIENERGSVDSNDFWKIFDSVMKITTKEQVEADLDNFVEPNSFQVTDHLLFESELSAEDMWKCGNDNKVLESSRFYADECRQWLDVYEDDVVNSSDIFIEKNRDRLVDSLEVIKWYAFFISAKLYRALVREREEFMELPVNSDENGSAKIALIAINRSIVAWSIIRSVYKNDYNHTAGFIGQLISIRRVVEQIFPNATEFIRPGFDTE
jgi:hypothetical protein